MKHIVYRGRLRTAVVNRIEFPKDTPVPVKPELAERLLKLADFHDVTPTKKPKASKSEPDAEPTPTPEEQPEAKPDLLSGLWAR